ncbi:hypothetical protein HDU77_001750 [Chytriomyces hyalinus]|nr:hypothetical protein HDU77_001750 [Chytriomyces hyalinus]
MQKRCRFYNGKLNSCRKGDTCEFSHIADDPSGPSDAGRGSSKNDHKTKFAQKDYGKSKDPCKAFFAKGRCRNGGECRFVHIANNLGSPSASSNVRARAEEYAQLSARLVNSQLLSYRGSALLAAHEGDQRYTPYWKAVINHGHFGSLARSQGKATKFVQSLLQASFVDAESLLMELGATTPPQSQTSREVLTTLFNANYSHACSTSMKQSLSFQRCLVPLLVVLVSERVINSPVSVYVSAIFGIVRSSLETFLGKYLDCVDACLQQGTVDDLSCPLAEIFSSDPSICVPMYFVQVALPFIRCLQEVVSIFADVAYETAISSAVERIGKQLSSTAFKKTESQYALNVAIHEYERLFSIVNKARRELKLGEIVSDFDAMKISKKLKASAAGHSWSFMEQLIPAGSLPVAHSNDHFHISRIAIIPTMDEIKSSRQPALPGNFQSVQQAHWLAPGPDRLLDTHFRLLREDLVRPVRSNIMGFIGYILSDQAAKQKGIRVRNNRVAGVLNPNFENGRPMQLDVSYYENANIDGFEVVNQQGLCANVTFTRPQFMKGQTKKEQKDYWLRSGRLGYGMLVALIFKTSNVPSTDSFLIIFGIIATKNADKLATGPGEPCMVTIKIPLKFLTPDVLLTLQSSETNGYLIETNNIMFEGYRPILAALQKLNPAMLPFKELIAPASDPPRSPHSQEMIVPPSMYATVPNFFMNLSHLCKKPGSAVIRLHPESEISIKNAIRALNAHSTLDEGQSRALVSVLSRQVGCIQGPPGTGKSYVGVKIVQTLLQNKAKTTPRNPILVICFTNHALDQFITDLMDIGVKKIVRLGSTSNERVAPLLIKNLAAAVPQDTGISAFRVGHIMEEIKGLKEDLSHYNDSLGNRNKDLDWEVLSEHLQVCNYAQYDAFKDMRDLFIEEENEGFQVKGGRKNETIGASDVVKRWLAGADGSGTMNSAPSGEKWPRSDEELADDPDVWDMSIPERKALMAYWKRTVPRSSLDGILELQQRIEAAQAKLDGVYKDRDACSFRGFNIIGATTTGAAKNHSLIQAIAPKIVVCEEAGEVLESHTLAALQPDVQQLILIGDHLQLRPRVALHELTSESADGKKYRLDFSMFERLQDPAMKFPMETLNVQRRMRPTIADFIRKLFYPQLKDAPHVQTYPDVAGIRQNVYFVDHKVPQDQVDSSGRAHSHSNKFESEYCISLLKYLIRQGYAAADIVVLTPYVGQLLQLRDLLSKEMMVLISEKDMKEIKEMTDEEEMDEAGEVDDSETSGNVYGSKDGKLTVIAQSMCLNSAVRVSTIDNFQGEEAKIILISLVRSEMASGNESIGFLKTPNRTNVLLSRAKHGMYLIGNSALLSAKSAVWQNVIQHFEEKDAISGGLPIYCQKHPNETHNVSEAGQFLQFAPSGGCFRPCEAKLHGCGHKCPNRCHSDFFEHKGIYCHESCTRLHSECGHPCVKRCGDNCGVCMIPTLNKVHPKCGHTLPSVPCHVAVSTEKLEAHVCVKLVDKVLRCGHTAPVPCHMSIDIVRCKKQCNELLSCEHPCGSTCGKCVTFEGEGKRVSHEPCSRPCTKTLPCRHNCAFVCSKHLNGNCPPCSSPCQIMVCSHSKCHHKCSELCQPCKSPCGWTACEHQAACPLVCGAPCLRLPCDKRCTKKLSCGHQCPSVCSETCPDVKYCQVCCSEAISDQQADVICMTSYGELELDEDPVVVLNCGHVFTIATLDGTLDMDTVYSTDEDGWRLAQLPPEFIALPVCPSCRSRIVGVKRYGRILNLAVCRTAEKMWISQTASNMNDFSVQVNNIANEALVNTQNVKLPLKGKLAGFLPLKQLTRKLEEFQKVCTAAPQRRMFEASVAYLCETGVKHEEALEMMALSLPKPHSNFARMSVALVASTQLIHAQWLSRIADRLAGSNEASSFVKQSITAITKTIDMTTKALKNYKPINSRQVKEMSEYELELLTFELRVEKFRVMGRRFEITGGQDFDRKIVLADLDSDWGVFKSTLTISFMSQHNARVKALDEKLENLKHSGRLSVEEMKIVAHAMEREFGIAGHWYQCPNGHPYAIGECGMAMQQARCYECGVLVGGQSHRLTSDNRAFDPLDIN